MHVHAITHIRQTCQPRSQGLTPFSWRKEKSLRTSLQGCNYFIVGKIVLLNSQPWLSEPCFLFKTFASRRYVLNAKAHDMASDILIRKKQVYLVNNPFRRLVYRRITPEAERLSEKVNSCFEGNCEILRTIFQSRVLSSDIPTSQ